MKTKTMLLAVSALAALALAALPALAAADEVDYENAHFTVTNEGSTELKSHGETITCEEATGTGEFTEASPATTGHIQLTFHGCHLDEFECHSAGHDEGTITTRVLPFHIVQLTNDGNEDTAGILMTPGGSSPQTFAEFSCVFELVPIHVLGNGVIGDITNDYEDPSSTFTIDFEVDEEGNQAFTTVHGDETETEYELEAEIGGEGPFPATQEGKGEIHFTNGEEAEITTTPETE